MTALDLLHALVLDDGRRWGEAAVPWQREDARAILAPAELEPRLHWIGRPKGGSKTTDLAGMSIAWLVEEAPALAEGFAGASDKDQAGRLLRRAAGFIQRTPGLASVLEVQASKIVHRSSGATVEALAADVAGSEGLLSPWIVVDELVNWADTETARGMWTSLFSGVEKWPGMRLVVISHAGDPAHWSRKVFIDATAELGWRRVEVPGPLAWVTPKGLERQRRSLLPSQFSRRHLNVWTAGEDRLSTEADVAACVRQGALVLPPAGARYVAGLDLGVAKDSAVVTVAHGERAHDGRLRVVVDVQEVWRPSRLRRVNLSEVEARVRELCQSYGARLWADPWQAEHILGRLRENGIRAEAFNFSSQSVGRLAVTMYRLLRDHLLEIPDDPGLIDELVNARLREPSPGVYRIDHDSGRHDDRVLSLALAAHALVDQPVGRAPITGTGRRAAERVIPTGMTGERRAAGWSGMRPLQDRLNDLLP